MEDFRKLTNGVLGIQIFKVQTEALTTYKKNALEELGTIVYTISHKASQKTKRLKRCAIV
jgi:hypothetical protein